MVYLCLNSISLCPLVINLLQMKYLFLSGLVFWLLLKVLTCVVAQCCADIIIAEFTKGYFKSLPE